MQHTQLNLHRTQRPHPCACRADVYDRMTIFEDHVIRDINAGRFSNNTSLVLVTHGLALRVFLMRWFHWSVDQFMNVYNPPNAEVGQMQWGRSACSAAANMRQQAEVLPVLLWLALDWQCTVKMGVFPCLSPCDRMALWWWQPLSWQRALKR